MVTLCSVCNGFAAARRPYRFKGTHITVANWASPSYSRSRVKNAGKRIRDDRPTDEDILVLENWRASHAYVLNTFQTNLRRRAHNQAITVAQRLKRRPTIVDKLRREPTMQLDTMHDIAGCRLIFSDESNLYEFRNRLSDSRAKHKRRHDDNNKYDYIKRPKSSGYRGVHDIYEYTVESKSGLKWNGLHVEIQFRTKYQHAWATAVEAADIVTLSRIKFSKAERDYQRFFLICSEMISCWFEKKGGFLPEINDVDLVFEFDQLNENTQLLSTLRNLRKQRPNFDFRVNTIFILPTQQNADVPDLQVRAYQTVKEALADYNKLEKELEGRADIVLVRAENAENLRDAFRNYFSDVGDFVDYVDRARQRLAPQTGRRRSVPSR